MKTAFTYPRKYEFIYLLPLIGGMARITAVKKLKILEVGLTRTTKETILEDIILLVSLNEYLAQDFTHWIIIMRIIYLPTLYRLIYVLLILYLSFHLKDFVTYIVKN